MASPALVVLAAGMGSRYGGLKQIDPVGPSGEVVLDYSVFDALRNGFTDLVFIIRRDIEALFRDQVGRRFESKASVRYVFQETENLPGGYRAPEGRTKPWGTGHAVWCATSSLRQPFAVINADDFYGVDSFRQLGQFLSGVDSKADEACMVGFRLAKTLSEFGTVSRGICRVSSSGLLETVEECPAIERTSQGIVHRSGEATPRLFTGDEIVSMNCWGFTPAQLPFLERHLVRFLQQRGTELKSEFYLPAAVAAQIEAQETSVRVLPTESDWFGVTYREDHPHVAASLRALIEKGVYPHSLWKA